MNPEKISPQLGKIDGQFWHWCPACETMHNFAVDAPFPNGAQWSFDGNVEAPTFMPSMLIRVGHPPKTLCHYFIKAGMIEFLSDSSHALAGKTVPLPPIPPGTLSFMDA